MNAHSGGNVVIAGPAGLGRSDRLGLFLWLVFAVIAVATRGVRWDEAYEHAQILSGRVLYPHDHPLFRYVHNSFSLQTYLSAAVVWLTPNPLVLCGARNVLFVLTSALPAYLFARRLAGDSLWGHAAGLLALTGIYTEFDSSYPVTIWPTTFTNGYLGGGYMLVTLYLVLTRRLRSGLFLLGLAPAIHIGQLPAIAPVCAAFIAWTWFRGDRAALLRAIPWGLAGLAVCVAFAGVMRLFHVPGSDAASLPSSANIESIWKGYTAYVDPHRKFPSGNAHVTAIAAILLAAGAARTFGREQPLWNWLFLFSAGVAATVWSVMAIHAVMGHSIPFILIGWMPYRLFNLLLPIGLAAVIGILASADIHEQKSVVAGRWVVLGALVFGLALPLVRMLVGGAFTERYLASGEFLLLFLTGAAYSTLSRRLAPDRPFYVAWQSAVVIAFIALAAYHHLGAAAFALGAVAVSVVRSVDALRVPAPPRIAVAAIAALVAAALVHEESKRAEHFPHSYFDREIATYLAGRGEPNAMLLARPYEFLLQARTDHPVLVETATASLMSYIPALGPSIQQTYQDLYGIRFDQPCDLTIRQPDWKEIWAARTPAEWNALAEEYKFDYVVANGPLPLKMTEALRGNSVVLYRARL